MSRLFRRIQDDPELLAKEEELKNIAAQRGEVEIAMKKGSLSEVNGNARLAELEALNQEARQGSVYERWKRVYDEAAEAARARRGIDRE